MTDLKIGYTRVSTAEQDVTAQRQALARLDVDPRRAYVDYGLTGTNRERPGLREALAACRTGDILVVTKLDSEGMAVARAKGRLKGKQPKLSPQQEAHLMQLYRAGAHNVSELGELFTVTRQTVCRAVARAGGRSAGLGAQAGQP